MMATFTRSQFFDEVLRTAEAGLPADLVPFKHGRPGHLVKIYYGNERIHYEVWPDSARKKIEIGLHFEEGPDSTQAWLHYFDDQIVALKAQLGPEIELERWTTSWAHIYEEWPFEPYNEELAGRLGARIAQMIEVLEPLVREADVDALAGVRRRPTS